MEYDYQCKMKYDEVFQEARRQLGHRRTAEIVVGNYSEWRNKGMLPGFYVVTAGNMMWVPVPAGPGHSLPAASLPRMSPKERRAAKKDAAAKEAPPAVQVAAASAGHINVSPALQKLITKHCKECHDTTDDYPLVGDTLTEKDVAWILDRVAFGAMPKDVEGLKDATRRQFIDETTAALFTDAKDRADATAYYGEMMRANPVHRFFSAMRNVNAAAGNSSDKEFRPNGTESAVTQALLSYSPGLAVAQGVTAIKACSKIDDKVAREKCVLDATDPNVVMAGIH